MLQCLVDVGETVAEITAPSVIVDADFLELVQKPKEFFLSYDLCYPYVFEHVALDRTFRSLDCLVDDRASDFFTSKIVFLQKFIVGEEIDFSLIKLRPGQNLLNCSNRIVDHSTLG